MLHYDISEDAAVVAANRKTTRRDIWDVAGALLTLLASMAVLSGILQLI